MNVHEYQAKDILKKYEISIPEYGIASNEKEVDEVICLDAPLFFGAVGAFYEIFAQTEDEEVIALMKKATA